MNGRLENLVKSPISRVEGGATLKETTNHKYRVNAPPSTPPDFEEIWPYIKDMAPASMERVLELIAKGPAWFKVLRDTYVPPTWLPDGGRIVFVTYDDDPFVIAEWPERTEVWRLRPDTNVWTKLAPGDWLFAKALFEGGVRSWESINSVFHVPSLPEHLRRFT